MKQKNIVTYADVRAAVDFLIGDGISLEKITLRQVRDVLGDTGSLSTINRHLGSIKLQVDDTGGPDITEADLQVVRDVMSGIVNARVDKINYVADAKVEGFRLQAERTEAALSDATELNKSLEAENRQLQADVNAQGLVTSGNERDIAELQGEVKALRAVIATFAESAQKSADQISVASADTAPEQPSLLDPIANPPKA